MFNLKATSMARVSDLLLQGFRGKINDLVFRKHGNTTVVYPYKYKKHPPSPKQMKSRKDFRRAVKYAKEAISNPEIAQRYKLKALTLRRGSAFTVAVKDYLKKPQVVHINLYNDNMVVITAKDDFSVEQVQVQLTDNTGHMLETGQANLTADGLWRYQIKGLFDRPLELIVTAWDIPGNSAVMKRTL